MAEVNINAKIEEALLKIKPAKQTGQFGIWADDVDDFIIATIKTNPEIDLSFVDTLSRVKIALKNERQREKQKRDSVVMGVHRHYLEAEAHDYNIDTVVHIFGQNGKMLPNSRANKILKESWLKYVTLCDDGSFDIDFDALDNDGVSQTERMAMFNNLAEDNLDKLSTNDYGTLFKSLEKMENSANYSTKNNPTKPDLRTRKTLFHELNHAIASKEKATLKRHDEKITNWANIQNNCEKFEDLSDIMQMPGKEFYSFMGGLPVILSEYQGENRFHPKLQYIGPDMIHEGETEKLAFEKMNEIYKGEFDYQKKSMAYFPMALTAMAGDLMFDDVLKKAYMGGNGELSKQFGNPAFNRFMQVATSLGGFYDAFRKQKVKKEKEQAYYVNYMKNVLDMQNLILAEGMKQKNEAKTQQQKDKANQILSVADRFADKEVWAASLLGLSADNHYELSELFLKTTRDNFESEREMYNKASSDFVLKDYTNAKIDRIVNNKDNPFANLEQYEKQQLEKLGKGEQFYQKTLENLGENEWFLKKIQQALSPKTKDNESDFTNQINKEVAVGAAEMADKQPKKQTKLDDFINKDNGRAL